MRRFRRLKVDDIVLVLSFLMLKATMFLNDRLCTVLMLVLMPYILRRFITMVKQNANGIFYLLMGYSIIGFLSTYFNIRGNVINFLQNTIALFEIIIIVKYNMIKNEEKTYSIITALCGIYLSLNALLIAVFPNGLSQGIERIWLLPTGKFSTAYLCIIFVALILNKYPNKRVTHMLSILLGLFTTIYMGCTTGLIAIVIITIIYFFPDRLVKLVANWKFTLCVFVILNAGIVVSQSLLTNHYVQSLIQDVLHRNLTLTGRTRIYGIIFEYISRNKWIGYGYGNKVIPSILGYGNAQNGILQLALNYGLIGTALFSTVILIMLKRDNEKIWLKIGFIMFVICSVVEVTFTNTYFYLILALAYSTSYQRNLNNFRKYKKRTIKANQ